MNFAPKSRQELKPTLHDGTYPATVTKAEEKVSRSGNDMIALTLRVEAPEGGSVLVNDWLIPNEKNMWKVYAFCEAAGLADRYMSGGLSANDCLGACVNVKVKNEFSEQFGEQARVKGYIKPEVAAMPEPVGVPAAQGERARKAAEERTAESGESDIPF
jgi:hypothetical protein